MSTDPTAPVPPADRHPATAHLMRQFRSDHLPPSLREVSERCQHVAQLMLRDFPDGPELTAGLRKLLEAKDCFVRHAVDTAAEPVSPRFEVRADHNTGGAPTFVIWDTQTDQVAINPAGYREEYLLPESAEDECAYLNLTPEEQAAIHAEAARREQAERQKCLCGHGMVSHGTADRHCTMCVVNGVLGCPTFQTGEDTDR